MRFLFSFVILLVAVSLFFGCENDDHFSTDNNLRLDFSADTVRFDTVFATIGTSTKRIKIYNRNKDAITINAIELVNDEKTGFRMNVDGESGNTIRNVDILGKDSIYVFIEVTINPLDQNIPLLIADSIRFQFNGVTQYVHLEAIGQNVVLWKGKTIDKDTLLTGEKPFLIYDSLYVKENVTLDIAEGVNLYFHAGAGLTVSGIINAVGSIDRPIVFRGDRTDLFLETSQIPYDRIPGQWEGIKIQSQSFNNNFENVRIRNSIYGILLSQSDTTQTKVRLLNAVIQNTTKEAFLTVNNKIDARNSLFANSGINAVRILGGTGRFLHCTIANYLQDNLINVFAKEALVIQGTGIDQNGKSQNFPLGECTFINTVISGRSIPEVSLPNSGETNYRFLNCLIKTSGTDDSNFVNTVWGVDPDFAYVYSRSIPQEPNLPYFFNFDLTENSPARRKASRLFATELPFDLRGISRIGNDTPDIGCYQWKFN